MAALGGKGAGLARLTAAGFPVPAWFVIDTDCYRAYVAANRLDERIAATLADVSTGAAALASASATIEQAFLAPGSSKVRFAS